jgi:hypothetical protein
MNTMRFAEGHSDIPLAEWEEFRRRILSQSPSIVDEMLDRAALPGLPPWFLPLARGGAVASDHLLRRAGYHPGSHPPVDWKKIHRDVFVKYTDGKKLMVRGGCKKGLWTVERYTPMLWTGSWDEVLVHPCGSTPIFTRNHASAKWLAEYCCAKPPPGLLWLNACPTNYEKAIEFAEKRRSDEALARQSAHPAHNQRRAA